VGNRMEMLEIANYGHKLREKQLETPTYDNAASARPQGRKRAISIGHRDSVLYDEDAGGMVMDETPLTDMEADTDREADVPSWVDQVTQETNASSSSTERQSNVAHTPRQPPESQIPRPSIRATSESPQSSSLSNNRQQQYASSLPQSQSLTLSVTSNRQNPTQKRSRTKSPAPSTSASTSTPTTKRTKVAAVPQKRSKSNVRPSEADRSTAEYPSPPDIPGGMADAIPSWTRPVPKGNWDEVVLPVVARKMGLEDQYEEATGAPEPKRTVDLVAPAPGTFGYDPSKRRNRYLNHNGAIDENLQMDEFGQYPLPPPVPSVPEEKNEEPVIVSPEHRTSLRTRPSMRPRPPSPPPFSDYAHPSVDTQPVHDVVPSPQALAMQVDDEPDSGAGCCKCTIM